MAATLRQLTFIDTLVGQLGLEGELKDRVYEIAASPAATPVEIRELIDGLIQRRDQRRAREATAKQAEAGYYVRADGTAIVVVSNREGTHTYGKKLLPPETPGGRPRWAYERGLGISVAELTPMTASDAARIGLSYGHCIRCCAPLGGAGLSAAVSAIIGYGETCARGQGWPYPKGVVAQREYIETHGRGE